MPRMPKFIEYKEGDVGSEDNLRLRIIKLRTIFFTAETLRAQRKPNDLAQRTLRLCGEKEVLIFWFCSVRSVVFF